MWRSSGGRDLRRSAGLGGRGRLRFLRNARLRGRNLVRVWARVFRHVIGNVVDGGADAGAPGVGAEGVYVFVLGELDGLHQGLAEIGESGSGSRFDLALGDGGEEAAEGSTEIAGGEITAGEEIGDVLAHFVGGAGLGFLASVKVAEVRIGGTVRSTATAAIGKGERTQRHAVLGAKSRHGSLQKRRI